MPIVMKPPDGEIVVFEHLAFGMIHLGRCNIVGDVIAMGIERRFMGHDEVGAFINRQLDHLHGDGKATDKTGTLSGRISDFDGIHSVFQLRILHLRQSVVNDLLYGWHVYFPLCLQAVFFPALRYPGDDIVGHFQNGWPIAHGLSVDFLALDLARGINAHLVTCTQSR